MPEINQRIRLAWVCFRRFERELNDVVTTLFALKVCMLLRPR